MGKTKPESLSETLEELDIRGTANSTMSWIQQYMKDISKAPVAKQAAIGGLSGWVVGYLSMKVGKAAATVIGGSMIVIQLAAHQGYISIDWNRVNNDLENSAKNLSKEVKSRIKPGVSDKETTISKSLDKHINKTFRKLDEIEKITDNWVDKRMRSARKLYRKYVLGDSSKITVEELYALHMYILSFSACALLGRAVGRII